MPWLYHRNALDCAPLELIVRRPLKSLTISEILSKPLNLESIQASVYWGVYAGVCSGVTGNVQPLSNDFLPEVGSSV